MRSSFSGPATGGGSEFDRPGGIRQRHRLGPLFGKRFRLLLGGLELQRELRRRIEEPLDGVERHHEFLRHVVERQFDFEMVVVHMQVPVLMLQHDRHFLLVLLPQFLGDADGRMLCVERNVEVVLARQAGPLHAHECRPDDAPQGILSQQIVAHQILSHGFSRPRRSAASPLLSRPAPHVPLAPRTTNPNRIAARLAQGEVQASVARCLRTPPRTA